MTLNEAQDIVKAIDGEYFDLGKRADQTACLDGNFTADQLEAMAILMRARPSF
jgi:hypothetical protein